jgi:hypothetical protein
VRVTVAGRSRGVIAAGVITGSSPGPASDAQPANTADAIVITSIAHEQVGFVIPETITPPITPRRRIIMLKPHVQDLASASGPPVTIANFHK